MVNSSPNGTKVRSSERKTGVVPLSLFDDHHNARPSGARTPIHSYHAQLETKKYARDRSASRAAPRAGCSSKKKGITEKYVSLGAAISCARGRKRVSQRQPRNAMAYTHIWGC